MNAYIHTYAHAYIQAGVVGEEEEAAGGDVKALADEQVKLVSNAMTFPNVQVVVYSTCRYRDSLACPIPV